MGLRIGRAIERRASVLALAVTTGVAGFTAESIALAKPHSPREGTIAYPVDPGEPSRAGRTMIRLAHQSEGGPKSGSSRPQPGMLRATLSRPDGKALANAAVVLADPSRQVYIRDNRFDPTEGLEIRRTGPDGTVEFPAPSGRASWSRIHPRGFVEVDVPAQGDDRPRDRKTLGTDRGDAALGRRARGQ